MANKSIQRAGALRFVGGPLDGHIEQTDTPSHEMPEVLGILVSSAIIEMLTSRRLEREMSPTSLAFYQQSVSDARHYTFVGATAPEAIELNDFGARPR
jgi:hypothetical protein